MVQTPGKTINRSYLHTILTNPVYLGIFEWSGQTFRGKHETFIRQQLFENVQAVIHGHHKGKYQKHDIAFRGMLTCAHDDCTVTAELKKGKYVYYRCSGYRGKCELSRFKEEEISRKLGDVLKNIHIPDEVLRKIDDSLRLIERKRYSRIPISKKSPRCWRITCACSRSEHPLLVSSSSDQRHARVLSPNPEDQTERVGLRQSRGAEAGHGGVHRYYNQQRYHEGIGNASPADVYYGRRQETPRRREEQKQLTIQARLRYNLERDEQHSKL